MAVLRQINYASHWFGVSESWTDVAIHVLRKSQDDFFRVSLGPDTMTIHYLLLVAGGAAIGAGAGLLVLADARIAGISSIYAQTLRADTGRSGWRLAFLAGLLLPALWLALRGGAVATAPWPVLAVAGLLVGIGTRRGSGCTSGHGVCGNANFSRRSFVATLTFMATAALAVVIVRHLV
jgi:uncharacterized membrane protein YedE/YeeE